MKKGLLIIICLFSIKTFAQRNFTTVYYITQKDCKQSIRFAKNKIPIGKVIPIKSDTVVLKIEKEYSGFMVYYDGKSQMIDVNYQPDGFYKITDPICSNSKPFTISDLVGSSGTFKSPVTLAFGGKYLLDASKLKQAQYYIIPNFNGKDLRKLTPTNPLKTIKGLNYSYFKVTDQTTSKQKDLIYILKDGKPSFYYHM